MVKLDLGVQIDGYVAVVAHTVVAGASWRLFRLYSFIRPVWMVAATTKLSIHLVLMPCTYAHAGPAPTAEAPVKGPLADVFMAAITAGEVAAKLIKPGNTNTQVRFLFFAPVV